MLSLSPHGEGYCKVCHFIVGLSDLGKLDTHYRGLGSSIAVCPGSGRTPPKRVPYASRKARFYCEPRRLKCPVCQQETYLLFDGRMNGHDSEVKFRPCRAGWHTPEQARQIKS